MKHTIKTGLSFGLTSGIITTLGLMIGLDAGTGLKIVVLGGIFTIAIADAFSDGLGIHISEESEGVHTQAEVWEASIFTFMFKFFVALSFSIPVILLNLQTAILVSIIWGYFLLSILSYYIARSGGEKARNVVFEHWIIMTVVLISTHFVGDWIAKIFSR